MVPLIQTLLPYIVLFYVLDCFIYLKKYQIALTSHFGKKYIFKRPGLRFIGFSPFCRAYITMTRPIFFSPDGVYIWRKPEISNSDLYDSDSFYYVLFKEIKNVEIDGTRLTINHQLSIDFYSSKIADSIAERILLLKKTRFAKRLEEINSILEYDTDVKEIKINSLESSKLLSIMKFLSALIFANIFALIPASLYFEQTLSLKFLVVSTASVYFLIILLSYWHLQSRLKLSMNSVGLLTHLILYPVSAIHVAQNLTRHSLPASDFVTVSAAFLDRDDFRNLLRKELKRIHYSKEICKDYELAACLKLKEEYLHRFLPNAGLALGDIFEQPRKQDLNAAGYCPLCEVEFIEGVDICPDCNLNLVPFAHPTYFQDQRLNTE